MKDFFSSNLVLASFVERLFIKTFCHCKYLNRRIVYSSGYHRTFTPAVIKNEKDMQISEAVIRLKPSALADNTLLDLHNSSYHTPPRPIIANYTEFSSRQLKQNRWISGLFILLKG